jgi:hypothetical protein
MVVRDVLKTLRLESWVKTTGGRGLHVVVPINPSRDWSECLEFASNVSEAIERTGPIYTTAFAKAGRERKILIDYLRNNRTNTSVSAFSPRARPGAIVSMPLDWKELSSGPERWTLATVPGRLKRLKVDPWAGYSKAKQSLSTASIKALRQLWRESQTQVATAVARELTGFIWRSPRRCHSLGGTQPADISSVNRARTRCRRPDGPEERRARTSVLKRNSRQ